MHFVEAALRLVARKAISKNTGARGLRSILENILMDAMYEVCSMPFFPLLFLCGPTASSEDCSEYTFCSCYANLEMN